MSLLQTGILVSGGQVLGVALSLFAGILFSRALGPDGMGRYSLLMSTMLMAASLVGVGIGNANIFFLNNCKVPLRDVVTHSVKAAIVIGLVLSACLTSTFLRFHDYFGQVSLPLAVALALGASAHVARLFLRPILVARFEVRRLITVDVIRPVVLLAGGGALALLGALGVNAALLLLVSGLFAILLVLLWYFREQISMRTRFDWHFFRALLACALKFSANSGLLALTQAVPLLLLRAFRREQFVEVGLYSRAVSLCDLAQLMPIAIGPLLYAKWSSAGQMERTRQAEMAARMNITYGIVVAVALVLLGRSLLWAAYGVEFMPAYAALRLLAPALAMLTLFIVCNHLLAGNGNVAIAAYIRAGSLVIIAVAAYLTIPSMGIKGAAIAMLLGNTFAGLAGLGVCWKLYRLNPLNCLFLRTSDVSYVRRNLLR